MENFTEMKKFNGDLPRSMSDIDVKSSRKAGTDGRVARAVTTVHLEIGGRTETEYYTAEPENGKVKSYKEFDKEGNLLSHMEYTYEFNGDYISKVTESRVM